MKNSPSCEPLYKTRFGFYKIGDFIYNPNDLGDIVQEKVECQIDEQYALNVL